MLERQPRRIVPHRNRPIVRTGKHDALFIDRQGIDNGFMSGKVVHESAFGAFPLFYTTVSTPSRRHLLVAACGTTGKAVFGRVDRQSADGLFVVGEGRHALACGQIPQSAGQLYTLVETSMCALQRTMGEILT